MGVAGMEVGRSCMESLALGGIVKVRGVAQMERSGKKIYSLGGMIRIATLQRTIERV